MAESTDWASAMSSWNSFRKVPACKMLFFSSSFYLSLSLFYIHTPLFLNLHPSKWKLMYMLKLAIPIVVLRIIVLSEMHTYKHSLRLPKSQRRAPCESEWCSRGKPPLCLSGSSKRAGRSERSKWGEARLPGRQELPCVFSACWLLRVPVRAADNH